MLLRKTLYAMFLLISLFLMSSSASAIPYNITASADTSVRETSPGTVFGDNETLFNHRDASYNDRVFFEFSVPGAVDSATLYFYVNDGYFTNGHTYLNIVSNDWSENTTTWNTDRPSTDVDVNADTYPTLSLGWNAINVSDLIDSAGTHSIGLATRNGWWNEISSLEGSNAAYLSVENATTYDIIYVNSTHPSASDSNTGGADDPFETLGEAVRLINENGTIYLIGGTVYNESITVTNNYVNIFGVDNPVIRGTWDGAIITFSGPNGFFINNTELSNTATAGSPYGIYYSGNSGDSIVIDNCNITTKLGSAVYFAPSSNADTTISGSNIESDATYTGFGVEFDADSSVDNVIITGGTIHNYYSGAGSDGHAILIGNNAGTNINIVGNNVSGTGEGIMSTTQTSGTKTNLFRILDNYIWAYGGSGIYMRSGDDGLVDENHIMWATYTGIKPNTHNNVTWSNNILSADGYGHNAIEIKGNNSTFEYNTISGHNASLGDSWAVLDGAGTELECYDIVRSNYAEDTKDPFILLGGHQFNMLAVNNTAVDHDGVGLYQYAYWTSSGYLAPYRTSDNTVFDNNTIDFVDSTYYPYIMFSPGTSKHALNETDYANYTRDNITWIDNKRLNNTKGWYLVDYYNDAHAHKAEAVAINPDTETIDWNINYPDECDTTLEFQYYANIKVVDSSGIPIPNATLTFEANITNPETGEILKPHNTDYGNRYKLYTDKLDVAYTNAEGRTDNRSSNQTNTVAMTSSIHWYTTSAQSSGVEWNVTATYDNVSSSTVVTPSMLIYSPNSSNIQSELVTIVLPIDNNNNAIVISIMITSVMASAIYLGRSKIKTSLFSRWRR